jgi:hypothetical protein
MATADSLLLSAANFLVLAGSTVTNSGPTVLTGGNLGLYPGTSVTGFPPGVIVPPGVEHVTDSVAQQAEVDLNAALTHYLTLTPATTIVGALDGQTFHAGTYNSGSAILLNVGQTVILDAQGNPNAQFVFQAGSSITFGVSSTVVLINGALAANVIWAAQASITVGTSAVIVGDLLASSSVSLGTGASLNGRALANTGAVTLLGNALSAPLGSANAFGPPFPIATFVSGFSKATLTELCFPDCTGKSIRAWGIVSLTNSGYTLGGIPLGMYNFLDVRTVDVNGILQVEVYGEEPVPPGTNYSYHYSPVNDALQIFFNNVELANGQALAPAILNDFLLFEAQIDRTSTRG